MKTPEPTIRVNVDVTNPGQFFACCGLLELAGRLWPGAEGWFSRDEFCLSGTDTLADLLSEVGRAKLLRLNAEDEMASPLRLSEPFNLTLNWWKDEHYGGKQLKVWAGSMRNFRIAQAMCKAVCDGPADQALLFHAGVVYDPEEPTKKVEPFYYDSCRGANAQSIDLGFAPDSLQMTTDANPAVEFLCLPGMQRFRPMPTDERRVFTYQAWRSPLVASIASVAACGLLAAGGSIYRFENAFRTDQKKHKCFLPATPVQTRGES